MQRKFESAPACMTENAENFEDALAMRAVLGIGPNDPLPRMVSEVPLSMFVGRSVDSLQRDRWRKAGFPYEALGRNVRYDWRKCARLQREGQISFD